MSKTEFTTADCIQLFQLLDRFPDTDYAQSYQNNLSDVWELVRGRLLEAGIDPDDLSGQTPAEDLRVIFSDFDNALERIDHPVALWLRRTITHTTAPLREGKQDPISAWEQAMVEVKT